MHARICKEHACACACNEQPCICLHRHAGACAPVGPPAGPWCSRYSRPCTRGSCQKRLPPAEAVSRPRGPCQITRWKSRQPSAGLRAMAAAGTAVSSGRAASAEPAPAANPGECNISSYPHPPFSPLSDCRSARCGPGLQQQHHHGLVARSSSFVQHCAAGTDQKNQPTRAPLPSPR